MAKNGKNTLTSILNNKEISEPLIELLYMKNSLNLKDAEFLYAVALILIEEYEKGNQQFYIDFAYYIIAKTSFKINDYSNV